MVGMRTSLMVVLVLSISCAHALSVTAPPTQAPTDDPCDNSRKKPDLFSGMAAREVAGLLIAALGLMLAAGGGIGGGGILVPVYILVMGFSPKVAIPLSNVTILGGSISNIYLNSRKRHPQADRPQIDYDVANLMEPLTIAGAVVGSLLNKILVPWIITSLLVALLGLTTWNTYNKAVKLYRKESIAMAELANEEACSITTDTSSASNQMEGTVTAMRGTENKRYGAVTTSEDDLSWSNKEQGDDPDIAALIERERHVPKDRVAVLVVCFIGVIIMSVLKGEAMSCGSAGYWFLTFLPIPYSLVVAAYVRDVLLKSFSYKCSIGYPWKPGDVKWDSRATITYPLLCSMAGLFAGLFGIGGGIVKGPLMLEMKMLPEVASATAAYMIFFTASSATFSFAFLGEVAWSYAWLMFLLGLVFTFIGQVILSKIIAHVGRPSYIAFVITGIVGLSVILMTVEGIRSSVHFFSHHCSYAPNICDDDAV